MGKFPKSTVLLFIKVGTILRANTYRLRIQPKVVFDWWFGGVRGQVHEKTYLHPNTKSCDTGLGNAHSLSLWIKCCTWLDIHQGIWWLVVYLHKLKYAEVMHWNLPYFNIVYFISHINSAALHAEAEEVTLFWGEGAAWLGSSLRYSLECKLGSIPHRKIFMKKNKTKDTLTHTY